jgi:hypothetical protein
LDQPIAAKIPDSDLDKTKALPFFKIDFFINVIKNRTIFLRSLVVMNSEN